MNDKNEKLIKDRITSFTDNVCVTDILTQAIQIELFQKGNKKITGGDWLWIFHGMRKNIEVYHFIDRAICNEAAEYKL